MVLTCFHQFFKGKLYINLVIYFKTGGAIMSEMKGIFTIPQTPFDESMDINWEELRREIDFCVEAGAHGLVMPVLASEFYVLSDEERKKVIDIVVDQVNGKIPVIAGIAAVTKKIAVMLGKYAADAGADAVIALPPYVGDKKLEDIYDYYNSISKAIDLPIFVQNASPPYGAALKPEFVAKMAKEIDHIDYIKEEVVPCGHSITNILQSCGDNIKGVFGGFHGIWMLDELRRGASGCMPGCEYTDIHVQIYEHFVKGNEKEARALFNKLLPLLNMTRVGYGLLLHKEVLVRRGILGSNRMRISSPKLDKHDIIELEINLKEIEPHFKVR